MRLARFLIVFTGSKRPKRTDPPLYRVTAGTCKGAARGVEPACPGLKTNIFSRDADDADTVTMTKTNTENDDMTMTMTVTMTMTNHSDMSSL